MKSTNSVNRKNLVFCSMAEFERAYFPESLKKRLEEKPSDAQAIGTSLAKDSLQKIKRHLRDHENERVQNPEN